MQVILADDATRPHFGLPRTAFLGRAFHPGDEGDGLSATHFHRAFGDSSGSQLRHQKIPMEEEGETGVREAF